MAISRDKKQALVTELTELFDKSKSVVSAIYTGLSVADIQALRALARENDVNIKVTKNRLVKVALKGISKFKSYDENLLSGQLIYAFSKDDEIAPAQILAKFAKDHSSLELVCGFDDNGNMLDKAIVVAMSELPTKDQLRSQLVGMLSAPLTSTLQVMNGSQASLVRLLNQKVSNL